MGLSHTWVCALVLLIIIVCHMSVITHGDETIEAGKWSCRECELNPRRCRPRARCRPRGGPPGRGGGFGEGRGQGLGGGGKGVAVVAMPP
ncbi:hypothetical protein HanRHA438_Chr16g0746011 [Helianthus annuus]|uniref:Uncharacterized protein n=1 Tax=Helianthus annuus TaxID=4232 RepID=A0A9K3GXN4_HELAN|nr:hypothetical protein HanXRQr2_Chr16g0733591 [Helianthus annuus]KAJ0437092.1 hypothetical protein HanHA300_Chr16g0598121 [Helianthus annuus]KAJ0441442.1 hypothetical protein HanIR_Chr16g0797801 [Helianthus annuus]KAJ0459404.1 hypothetical protein HanHA89_Chr16g0648591 [Helianthus annuus]KAJ0639934.1 hypothetical protein HanLR1_Chr16g0609431 [Helianthus annuus]